MLKRIFSLFALSFLFMPTPSLAQVTIYTWPEYKFDAVFEAFEKETGIKMKHETFEDMGDMSEKIEAKGGQGYDIVMLSVEYISKLQKAGYLMNLDHAKLPEIKNIDKKYLGLAYDPKNEISLPFAFGTTTFVINTEKVKPEQFTKLEDLAKPEFKGRLLLPSEARAVLSIGLRIKGHSLNEKTEPKIKEAFEVVRDTVIPNVKLFDSDNSVELLENGEVDIAMLWNTMSYEITQKDAKFVDPTLAQGKPFWIENLVVMKNTSHADEVHKFLNFIMRPDIAAKLVEEFTFSTSNAEALKLLPAEIRENRILFPDEAEVKRGEFEVDLGSSIRLYEKYWNMLKGMVK